MKNFLLIFVLCSSQISLAQEVQMKLLHRVQTLQTSLGIGSQVELDFLKTGKTSQAFFVGRMVGHPNFGDEIMFMDAKTGKILMIDGKNLKSSMAKPKMHTLVSSIDQSGETCAAYGIYHFWYQINAVGIAGSQEFSLTFSQETRRMKLLEEAITGYYMARSYNVHNVMKKMGDRFGFKCRERTFTKNTEAIAYVYSNASLGKPVIMEFNIGPEMIENENDLVDYETKEKIESYLWGPRKIGQRNVGGHVVVAAAAFEAKGTKKAVVLDSNWNEPRIWDMEQFLGGKTAIKEMIFHHCESANL